LLDAVSDFVSAVSVYGAVSYRNRRACADTYYALMREERGRRRVERGRLKSQVQMERGSRRGRRGEEEEEEEEEGEERG